MMGDVDFATAPWFRGSDSPDPNGPLDVPYTPYPEAWFDRPVIEIIGEVASHQRHHIAVDDCAMRLTYGQLYAMVCELSHRIDRANLPPGPIGVKVQDGALYVVAMLACLASGRPCLLLNQDNPSDYNQSLIKASGLRILLVNEGDGSLDWGWDGLHLIPVESILTVGDDATAHPAARLGVDEPAFIVSTSGSTGTPKLIARSQRGLHQRVRVFVRVGHFNADDRILVVGSPAVGAAISRRFLPLLIGATLHIVDVPRAGMAGILKVLRDDRITCFRTTASLVKALSQLDGAAAYFAGLRMIWGAGEMLLQRDLAQIRTVLPPGCRFGYSLSMTEASVACWFVPEKDEHDPVRVAAGYVAPDTEVLVLDENGLPCPVGEVGELVVRSESVALGEWRDGALASDRFQLASPTLAKRIYHTGDMVRMCRDGVMVVHGRKDRMIKIRGLRVEPAVIEATMRDIPGVADAAVVARLVDGGYRIHGFVVPGTPKGNMPGTPKSDMPGTPMPSAGNDDLSAMVREALRIALPVYMRPYDIRIVEALPISVNNKVDTRALLQHLASLDDMPSEEAPRPAAMHAPASQRFRDWVADAWRGAFGADRDSTLGFDAAGGDSLQFMQIVFRFEQLAGVSLPLNGFDVGMSQEDMARRLDVLLGGGLETQAQGKPIFFIPGLGGDEPRLLKFRAGCAPGLSFRCLEFGDWPQWVAPGFKFDRIVEDMVARIQEAAPSGPLTLAGYSLGGQVALAIAANLCAAGREIEDVLILDSGVIVTDNDVVAAPRAASSRFVRWRAEFREWRAARRRGEGSFAAAMIVTRRLVSPRWAPLLRWIARHRRTVLPGQVDFYLSFYLQRRILHELAIEWRHSFAQTPRISAPITVFKARERARGDDRDAMAWEKHSPTVTVISVDGDHFTMFDPPHLADLCARFTAVCAAKPALQSALS